MTAAAEPVLCDQPTCGGAVVDGYCSTCGLAPVAPARPGRESGPGRASSRVDVDRLTSIGSVRSGPTSRRSRIGAGVVDIDPIEEVDPATVVLAEPSVPEGRRFCTRCDSPVGRSRDGREGRQAGFCASCGASFDFAPKLRTGELVAGQYEVAGALAHGGLGWLYLVRDRNVSNRWCVLKGLLDVADPAAAEAAVAERRFLAEVRHPAIVDIYNFVNHGGQGYIVMEYVGGPSLKQLTVERRQAGEGPMAVAEAAAYVLAVLPAFAYLHERGLVYCDFKPDNLIHVGDTVELIDLGGVRRIDDPDAAIFGTPGYQAPEVPRTGPTVASDLYTIGRTLAVLILDWPAWQRADRERLPPREDQPVLMEHESLWRFLQRACAPDPADRFASADEMAAALHGVLCQVAAASDGQPRPFASSRWGPPQPTVRGPDWRALPWPILPSHPHVPNRVAGLAMGDPAAVLGQAPGGELSWADRAAVVRALLQLGKVDAAPEVVEALDAGRDDVPESAEVVSAAAIYLRGVVALAAGDHAAAVRHLDAAYDAAPGEPACALSAMERPADAARVLTAVPAGHPARAEALTLACRQMQGHYDEQVADAVDRHLRDARAARSPAEAELAVALYQAALAAVLRGESVGTTVAGRPASVPELARGAEAALLDLAATTPDAGRRHDLVDAAARTRPWSMW